MPARVKLSMARWRDAKQLPALLRRLGTAVPATAGEAKVLAGSTLRGAAAPAAPAVTSLAKLPGAGAVVPTDQALGSVRKQQPTLLRRVLEGTGLAKEREYPAFRAQPQPFTGKRVDTGYSDPNNLDIMHVAPRAGGAEKYFRRAAGPLPGHAAIGTFDVPPGTAWYDHMDARNALLGSNPPTYGRHHLKAFETVMPPKRPLISFFGQQGAGGQAVETTKIDPAKLEKWYRDFSAPIAG